MSLKVGTLVMYVNYTTKPYVVGKVGEIVSSLGHHKSKRHPQGGPLSYRIIVPALANMVLVTPPHHVIPITPPGDPVDAKQDKEITA